MLNNREYHFTPTLDDLQNPNTFRSLTFLNDELTTVYQDGHTETSAVQWNGAAFAEGPANNPEWAQGAFLEDLTYIRMIWAELPDYEDCEDACDWDNPIAIEIDAHRYTRD